MLLYHGSNIGVSEPRIIKSKRLLDFGTGFYLTSDYEQAKKWAVRTTRRRREGYPVISLFDINISEIEKMQVLTFDAANSEWLRYVSANRTGRLTQDTYDVVLGPVANDQTVRTINDYLEGRFTEEIAIQLLLSQKLKDQYVFKTEKALSALKFKEVQSV